VPRREAGFREEVLNVKLAEVLCDLGILSVPEPVLRRAQSRRLIDIIIGEYRGVRVLIEGKVDDQPRAAILLEKACGKRLEESLCEIVFGVIYPKKLRHSSFTTLSTEMRKATLEIRVFTENGTSVWSKTPVTGLATMIRRAYSMIVSEDVVDDAVSLMTETMDAVAQDLSSFDGPAKNLRRLLVEPENMN